MFNIIKYYKLWFGVSIVMTILAIAAVATYGLKLGIDFKGGTLAEVSFIEQAPTSPEVKDALSAADFEAIVQSTDEDTMIIRTAPQEKEEHDKLLAVLSEKFGEISEDQFTSIGPVIGKELTSKAIYQFLLISLGIILYIAYAFRKVTKPVSSWRFGWGAIIALIHDLIVIIGVFAILGHFWNVEIDSLFVTALLTVLGFSVHDTIVVFDRIRENLRLRAGQSLPDIINASINQTIVRSLNTTLTVVFVLLALLLFGAESTKFFVLALLIGVTVGTYSSIFIASPILYVWHKWDLARKN